jgi:hypothetical protein
MVSIHVIDALPLDTATPYGETSLLINMDLLETRRSLWEKIGHAFPERNVALVKVHCSTKLQDIVQHGSKNKQEKPTTTDES